MFTTRYTPSQENQSEKSENNIQNCKKNHLRDVFTTRYTPSKENQS